MRLWLLVVLLVLLLPASADARMPVPPAVNIVRAPCPNETVACADPATNTAYVGQYRDRFTARHEVGHLLWFNVLWEADRQFFFGLGLTMETFADAYAACDLGLRPRSSTPWEVHYGYEPTPRQHLRVCNAISFIGFWRALHGS